MKKIMALILSVYMLVSISMTATASEIQPRSSISYGSTTIGAGQSKYLYNNGGNFSISAGTTVTVNYSANPSGSIYVYFHNVNTGINTRIFSSYSPTRNVSGYFYLYNHSNSSVYVSGISVSY